MTKVLLDYPIGLRYQLQQRSCMLALLSLILLCSGLLSGTAWAQTPTPGLIFKAATAGTPGAAVLDPNGDGYVSASSTGFTSADDVGTLSEIPYSYLPQVVTIEPNADLRVGPNNKFTDFADVTGGGNSVGFFVDANGNYMFRFRLGGAAPNSKGYSIAIDTDNKFGFTGPNADPDAVAGNPGFEMEILLASNFGVRLYNLNGTANPTGSGPDNSLVELPYVSHAQKAIAGTTNDGTLDVFYDFYIPLSVIQAQFGSRTFFNSTGTTAVPFSLNTPLRMVANTIIAPHSVTHYQNISDVGGVNDASFPNADLAFIKLITGSTPTSGNDVFVTPGTTIPGKTTPPVVNSPIQQDATTVIGTSVEVAGTVITVYVSGTALGTTTTVQSNGTWTLTGVSALATGALITATALVSTKSVSDLSNEVEVGGSPTCGTAMPVITCSSDRGIFGTAAPSVLVYLRFPNGNLVPSGGSKQIAVNPVTTTIAGNFYFTTSGGNTADCNNGQTNALNGTYLVSQIGSNSCESSPTLVCIGTAAATASPIVTTPRPITASTTSLTGTAPAGAIVTLAIDGNRYDSTTATASGTFTFSGVSMPPLTTGRVLTLTAAENNVSCSSAPVTLNVVTVRTVVVPPVVNSPLITGATTVTGTSVEASGSTIMLTTYANTTGTGTATGTFTTTVQANGTWSVPVTALAVNTSMKATVTSVDYGTSGFSNVVPVRTQTTFVPTITGTYNEGDGAVSGTVPAGTPVGALITVYEDDYPLNTLDANGNVVPLTTTVQTGGTWSLTGLSASATLPALYAGGVLTATATVTGQVESVFSNAVLVGCPNLAGKAIADNAICQNNSTTYTVPAAQAGIVYTLQNTSNNTNVGVSKMGTGADLVLTTLDYPTAGTYPLRLNTFSIGAAICQQNSTAVNLTVNPLPLARTITGNTVTTYQAARTGTNVQVQSSETTVSYQLVNTSVTPNANVGAAQTGTGGTLNLPTGPLDTSPATNRPTTTYRVVGTSTVAPTNCAQQVGVASVTYSGPLPVELTIFEAAASRDDAVLTWGTASEKTNDHFVVERSVNGRDFTTIGEVAGQGTATQAHAYAFREVGAARLGPLVYYRLRQVDRDGTVAFSPVRSVKFADAGASAMVLLYPNPTTADVTCSLTLLPAATYLVQVLNITGQVLITKYLDTAQPQALNVANLTAGLYLVHVQGPHVSLTQRLVKVR